MPELIDFEPEPIDSESCQPEINFRPIKKSMGWVTSTPCYKCQGAIRMSK